MCDWNFSTSYFFAAVVFSNLLFMFLYFNIPEKIYVENTYFWLLNCTCLDNISSILEVNHERILYPALFIFQLKIIKGLISLASIKERKWGPTALGWGHKYVTNLFSLSSFAAMVKRK